MGTGAVLVYECLSRVDATHDYEIIGVRCAGKIDRGPSVNGGCYR